MWKPTAWLAGVSLLACSGPVQPTGPNARLQEAASPLPAQ
jgi:hypothetical protein